MNPEERFVVRTPERATNVAKALARAFVDDPLVCYMSSDREARARFLPSVFNVCTQFCFRFGEVFAAGEDAVQGAVITVMDDIAMSEERLKQCGLDEMVEACGPEASGRFFEVMSTMGALREKHMPKNCRYYLGAGVVPDAQAQGIATRQLFPALAAAQDIQKKYAYLETMLPRNADMYRRWGFRTVFEGDLPGTGIHLWTMVRDPKPL